jgi:replication factor C large subunit
MQREEWTEKYRPKTLSDIVGNESAVRTMRRWAESWVKGSPKRKALVLRGEPGTGKTSAAHALANDFGWDVVEMNASDHRNADAIKNIAGLGSVGQTFTTSGEFLSARDGRRKLIILDEADNLFGREDYGGARAITETIKEARQPIILIVNDYYTLTKKSSSVKTLADKATFSRLSTASVVGLIKRLCDSEGVNVDEELLARIAENAGGDLRGAVNDLQMLAEGRSTVTNDDAGALGKRNQQRELESSLFEMFGSATARGARDATLGVDKTPDELIPWIDENIPLEMRHAEDMANAFDALSRADIYLQRTRRLQHYGLWGYAKEMMTGGVSLSRKRAPRRPPQRYNFPSYFMVMSRSKSLRNARVALSQKLAPHMHTSASEVRRSMIPYLRIMVRHDRELLVNLVMDVELDEGDVFFLLGDAASDRAVAGVMAEVKRRTTGEEDSPAGKTRARSESGKRKGSLADF